MNTYFKISVAGFIAGLFIIFFILHEPKQEKEASAGDEEAGDQIIEADEIDIQALPLPLENSTRRANSISHVMIHFTSNVTANPQNPYRTEDIYTIFADYGVSSHYLIDREGIIYNLVPEHRVAFHAGAGNLPDFPAYEDKLNDHSIGIELLAIGTKDEMKTYIDENTYDSLEPAFIGYTDAQYEALTSLLDKIHERHPAVKRNRNHIIGHDEYASDRKSDPGILFDWARIGY